MEQPGNKKYVLRLAPEIYADLEAMAKEEQRSVNGQIVTILKEAVARWKVRGKKHKEDKESAPDRLAA